MARPAILKRGAQRVLNARNPLRSDKPTQVDDPVSKIRRWSVRPTTHHLMAAILARLIPFAATIGARPRRAMTSSAKTNEEEACPL
jgi:hypothetical protein